MYKCVCVCVSVYVCVCVFVLDDGEADLISAADILLQKQLVAEVWLCIRLCMFLVFSSVDIPLTTCFGCVSISPAITSTTH